MSSLLNYNLGITGYAISLHPDNWHSSPFLLSAKISQNTKSPLYTFCKGRRPAADHITGPGEKDVTLDIRAVGLQNYDVHTFLLFVQSWNLIKAHIRKSFLHTFTREREGKEKEWKVGEVELRCFWSCRTPEAMVYDIYMLSIGKA